MVLPNAWDVASAKIFAGQGAQAVGTTSMGIAASAGFADVERIPLTRMLATVREIVAALDVPVSADLERGYGATPAEVAESVRRVIACGAVGINLEDGSGDPQDPVVPAEELAAKIRAARGAAEELGLPLVINGRTDVFLEKAGSPQVRLRSALERAKLYREAGADSIFVPGGLDRATIRALVQGIDAPLNVVANPAISVPVVPSIAELQELGVARVSVGSGPMRAVLSLTQRIAAELLQGGGYDAMRSELEGPGAAEAYATAIRSPET